MSSGHDGLQETCHVAHTCCVVLCAWIPASGPKNKQNTMGEKIGETKHAHYLLMMAAVEKYFEVINLQPVTPATKVGKKGNIVLNVRKSRQLDFSPQLHK